jgi:hypothetical protein
VSDGRSIRLFLEDGTPGGRLTAEIMYWTGHVVAVSRSDLAALLKRPETSRTGIYMLLGDDPRSLGGTLAHIGEGDEVRTRLRQHAPAEEQGGRDFWERAIVLTSKDANLTKSTRPLPRKPLHHLAQRARRSRLINGTAPPPTIAAARSRCLGYGVLHRPGQDHPAGSGRQYPALDSSCHKPRHRDAVCFRKSGHIYEILGPYSGAGPLAPA